MGRLLAMAAFGSRPFGSAGSEALSCAVRVFVGLALALAHGTGKLPPSGQFVQGVAKIGVPFPEVSAWFAAFAEFAGGLLLAIGLLVRPAALVIAITMAVAAFGAHGADPFARREMALLYLALALLFLISGGGWFSVDRLIRGRAARR